MSSIAWVDLDGVVNMRDVGGIPTADGGRVRPGRLLRSDNLQDLSARDIERLSEVGVTDVVDLRTGHEVDAEGPGPLRAVEQVAHHHHTLFKEEEREVGADDALGLPWDQRTAEDADVEVTTVDASTPSDPEPQDAGGYWTSHYLGYLTERPDSVLAALRVVAGAEGATIVHCAAGKDRTGTVVALALSAVGVTPEHVVADYAATAQRLEQIVARLTSSPTYRENLEKRGIDEQMPHPQHLARALEHLDETYGGVLPWLERQGWTEQDTAALRHKLLDD